MPISHFDKSQLPPPEVVFRDGVQKFRRAGLNKATALCPFHEDRRPSLSLDLERGLFHCFGCLAGGDLVCFVQLRYGLDFPAAKKFLGVDDSGPQPARHMVPVRYLAWDFRIDGRNYRATVRDEPQTYRQMIRRFFCDARDRLQELGPGESEAHESCWAGMALGFDELRELELAECT